MTVHDLEDISPISEICIDSVHLDLPILSVSVVNDKAADIPSKRSADYVLDGHDGKIY